MDKVRVGELVEIEDSLYVTYLDVVEQDGTFERKKPMLFNKSDVSLASDRGAKHRKEIPELDTKNPLSQRVKELEKLVEYWQWRALPFWSRWRTPKPKEVAENERLGPIVAWLVYTPMGHEFDYLVFADRLEAFDKQLEFDEIDPEHEHVVKALVCHPTWKDG